MGRRGDGPQDAANRPGIGRIPNDSGALLSRPEEAARPGLRGAGQKPPRVDRKATELALAAVRAMLFVIAHEQGIDLNEALERTLEKHRTRDLRRPLDTGARRGGKILRTFANVEGSRNSSTLPT